jgi:hypothetical protein
MSKSRWGGYRIGRQRYTTQWEALRTPDAATQSIVAPTSPLEFSYTTAQGIWNLNSTVNFRGTPGSGGSPLSFTFVDYGSSTDSASVTIPVSAQTGDIAVLFDSTATGAPALPSGWTSIYSNDATFEVTVSYKILASGEPGTTITGHSSNLTYALKQILIFRPSNSISTVTIGSFVTSGEISTTPAVQTINAGTSTPTIVFGMIRAYQTQPFINETFWNDSYYLTEANGNHMKVFYEIQTVNTQRTVTATADYGTYNHTLGFILNAS